MEAVKPGEPDQDNEDQDNDNNTSTAPTSTTIDTTSDQTVPHTDIQIAIQTALPSLAAVDDDGKKVDGETENEDDHEAKHGGESKENHGEVVPTDSERNGSVGQITNTGSKTHGPQAAKLDIQKEASNVAPGPATQCRRCNRKFSLLVKPKRCVVCPHLYCRNCCSVPRPGLLPAANITPRATTNSKQRLCENCNMTARIELFKRLREIFHHSINETGSYPVLFPVKASDTASWFRLYYIVHSELRKIQRFKTASSDTEKLHILTNPNAPAWSSLLDEIYTQNQVEGQVRIEASIATLKEHRETLESSDPKTYGLLMGCWENTKALTTSGEKRDAAKYLTRVLRTKVKELLHRMLQHEVRRHQGCGPFFFLMRLR